MTTQRTLRVLSCARCVVVVSFLGSSGILIAKVRMLFVLEGLFDNSPAIYRWVRAEAIYEPRRDARRDD